MEGFSLNAIELQDYQPNRYPFLMIDRVEHVVPGKSARGYKNLTLNEWYFPKHFPGNPNMPGALQLEALAQMLTVAITTLPGLKGKVTHALQHTVRFRKEVVPGDRFEIETTVLSWSRGICKGKGVARTNGEVACEADMLITIPDILEQYLPKAPGSSSAASSSSGHGPR
jgi:3-hydroxyacyl-[acyl-carrier-protein] dehydratase